MSIGNNLRSLMKENDINTSELAREIGVAPSTIYSVLQRDSKKMSIDLIIKIAHALGISADELLSGEKVVEDPFDRRLLSAYHFADKGIQKSVCKLLDIEEKNGESGHFITV